MRPAFSPVPDLLYRPLCPEDFEAVKAVHLALFPIKYEDTFFNKAVNSLDRIFSFAAFDVSKGYEELAGFITVRLCFIYELETVDRHYISQAGGEACAATSPAAYILTLGTVPGWQKCGVASALLALARQHAIEKLRCCAIFLHVISYNTAAIGLYTRNQYQCLGLLKDFYALPVGPESPERQMFDAYLFVQYLPFDALGAGHLATPWYGLSSRNWLSPVAHVSSGLSSVLSLGGMWQGAVGCVHALVQRQASATRHAAAHGYTNPRGATASAAAAERIACKHV